MVIRSPFKEAERQAYLAGQLDKIRPSALAALKATYPDHPVEEAQEKSSEREDADE